MRYVTQYYTQPVGLLPLARVTTYNDGRVSLYFSSLVTTSLAICWRHVVIRIVIKYAYNFARTSK